MREEKTTTLIVGAASSFGVAIAQSLSAVGHQLILAHSGRTAYQMPDNVIGQVLKFDVTNGQAAAGALADSKSQINNVVYSVSAPIDFFKFKDEQWQEYEKHWQTQVRGLWNIAQSLLDLNHPLQNIVVIGSAVTLTNKPMARLGAYTTAKYALLGLVKSLAVELNPLGININMVSPGATGAGLSKNWPSLLLRLSRITSPEAVAVAVVSLLSNQNDRTGENILA